MRTAKRTTRCRKAAEARVVVIATYGSARDRASVDVNHCELIEVEQPTLD